MKLDSYTTTPDHERGANPRLGTICTFSYCASVIGLLRVVGLFNAAIWFGAAVFFTFSVDPTSTSPEMKDLLGPKNSPFFSVAVGQLLAGRYFQLFLVCSLVSMLHLLAEWLYLGRKPRRLWTFLLVALLFGGAVQAFWVDPILKDTHLTQFTRPQQREAAHHSYRIWHGIYEASNFLLLAGLGVYLWRVANPPDVTRFVGTPKFRS
jgi:hypothetical protein